MIYSNIFGPDVCILSHNSNNQFTGVVVFDTINVYQSMIKGETVIRRLLW